MNIRRPIVVPVLFAVAAMLVAVSALAYAAGEQKGQAVALAPQIVGPDTPAPLQPYMSTAPSTTNPAAVASTLSYYFISGNTFTPGGSVPYSRQVIGCVNQMPQGVPFSAPVHLPQGSQVVSITLYTYDSAVTTSTSTAYFIFSDGKGISAYTLSAKSPPNTSDYRQTSSTENNPTTIDNQNYNYLVEWRKDLDTPDSALLSLCGVRVAYYAPIGQMYVPVVVK
ncbi:MAG: hypothetical protein N2378_18960 [Chloroflexaceae bacterium]|nr:hypothetical protein [Chloroflexaceae bacterium]